MLRRIVATTLTGLCALAGPVAAPALAAVTDTAPAVSLSTSSVRPGVAFTAFASVGCPEASGVQDVDFTYTGGAGGPVGIGTTQTDEDGTWSTVALQLPVTGTDDDGAWRSHPVAAGAGSVVATCYGSDEADEDPDDPGADDPGADDGGSDDGGSDDDGTDEGDGGEDGEDGDAVVTQTYAPVALTATGSAPALTVSTGTGSTGTASTGTASTGTGSAGIVQPGGTLTVTPADPCPTAADVEVDVVALNDDAETAETEYTSTDARGAWTPVTITLPDDAEPGDYGVTADCTSGDDVLASYDGVGLGSGTLRLGGLDCSGTPVTARVTGSYDGRLTGVTPLKGRGAVTAPATVRLGGRGPWNLTPASAVTGALLSAKTLACPEPDYDLDVSRPGVADGRVRARVCNTGNAPAGAALQVRTGKRFSEVDDDTLDTGDCTWLTGGRVAAGGSATARVLLDAPGRSDDEVSASFTVRRRR